MNVEITKTGMGINICTTTQVRLSKSVCPEGTRITIEMQSPEGEWSVVDTVIVLHPPAEKTHEK